MLHCTSRRAIPHADWKEERQWNYSLFIIRCGALNRHRRRLRQSIRTHQTRVNDGEMPFTIGTHYFLLLRLISGDKDGKRMKKQRQKENRAPFMLHEASTQSIYLHYILQHNSQEKFKSKNLMVAKREEEYKGDRKSKKRR